MADSIVSCISYHTSMCTPYCWVNPSTRLCLCSQTRLTRSEVTPMYSVPLRLLANSVDARLQFSHAIRPLGPGLRRDDEQSISFCTHAFRAWQTCPHPPRLHRSRA
jgi:hypothetical protein